MDQLTARSLQIRDEVQDAANTARRVGSLLADIVAAIRAAADRALSRESPDTAHGHITFADGLTSQAAMHTAGALTIGTENADGKAPTQFAPDGTGEMNALTLRGALRVAELQINKLTATAGEWILTESAVIESVAPAHGDGNSYTITLRREHKADFVPFIPGDIIKGIINTLALRALHPEDTPAASAPNATFATAWLLVESVDLDSLTLTARRYADADVPAPPSYVPVPQMRLARWGHLRDKARQSLLLLSSPEGRILHLQGVNAPGYRPADVAASFGTVPEFLKSLLGNALAPERDYAFVRGLIAQDIIMLDRDRLPIPQTVDRGVWAAATTYYAKERNPQTLLYEISDVWHQGARYRALITSTGVEPGTPAAATRWLLIQAAPKDGTPGAAGKDGRDGLNYAANLLDGTAFENLGAWAIENNGATLAPSRQSPVPDTHAVQILCPKGAYAGMSQLITPRLLPSTTYTLSVYSIATTAGAGELMIYPTPARALRVNVTTQWTRHYFTFTTPAEFSAGWVRCFLRLYFKKDAPDNVVYFAAPKLEAGEAPTEWCPSELDRKGTPGKDGINGKDGKPGAKGDKGDPGPKGDKGSPGKDGRDGLNYAANLLDGTAFEDLGAWGLENNGASIDPSRQSPIPGTHAVQILCPKGAYAGMSQLITPRLLPSTTYTLSVYSIATTAGAGELMIYPTPARALRVNVTTQWTRHYFTFTTPSEFSAGWVRCFLRLYFKKDAPDNVVYFAAPKLEAGEAPTEWCPSELDRKGPPGKDGKDGRDGLTPLPNLLDGTAFAESKLTSWKINLEHTGGKFERTDTYAALAGCSVVQGSLPLAAAKAGHYVEITQSLQRFVPGRTYTFSVWAKGPAAVWLIVYPNPGTHYEATDLKNDQWTRVSVSFTATEDTTPTSAVLRVRARGSSPAAGDVYADLCAPKLEEGPVPTPWSPSENDRKGAPGARGAVLRMRGVWSALPDGAAFESGAAGEEFLDVVSVETDGGLLHYHCTQTHTKTAADAPGPDSTFWKLGATFDLVATRLLLADKANIGKWYISDGNIVSRREDNPETYISLDAPRNVITLQRYFPASQTRRTLSLTATTGSLECSVDKYDSGRHYVSSTTVDDMGISVARAVTPSEGVQINETEGFVKGFISARITAPHGLTVPTAAVYGSFTDKTGGPVHGGWFTNLHAQGISLGARIISKNSQLESRSPFNVITQSTVCSMPYTHREGEMIFVRQVDGSTVLNALSNDVFWIPEGPAPIYRNEIAIGAGELFVLTFLRAPYYTKGHYDNDLTIRVWLLTKSTAGRM